MSFWGWLRRREKPLAPEVAVKDLKREASRGDRLVLYDATRLPIAVAPAPRLWRYQAGTVSCEVTLHVKRCAGASVLALLRGGEVVSAVAATDRRTLYPGDTVSLSFHMHMAPSPWPVLE